MQATIAPKMYDINKLVFMPFSATSLTPKIIVAKLIGIYNINENLNAVSLFKPENIPPTNVAPLRLIPGNKATT